MVLRVVVGLVSAISVIVLVNVLDMRVLALGQGMVMRQVVPLNLLQWESALIPPSFIVQYDDMVLALVSER